MTSSGVCEAMGSIRIAERLFLPSRMLHRCTDLGLTFALSAAAGAWAGWWSDQFRARGLEAPVSLAAILAMLVVLPMALAAFRKIPPTKGAWAAATLVSSAAYAGVMVVFLILILGPSNTPNALFGWLLVVPFVFGTIAWLVHRQHAGFVHDADRVSLLLAIACLHASTIVPMVTASQVSVGLQKYADGEPEEIERYLRREHDWDLLNNAPRAAEALSLLGLFLGSSAAIASVWRIARRRRFIRAARIDVRGHVVGVLVTDDGRPGSYRASAQMAHWYPIKARIERATASTPR